MSTAFSSTAFSGGDGAIAVTLVVTVAAAARGLWSPCGLSMISAVNPFTERSRGHRFAGTALWFVVGSVLGGGLLGVVGALGALAMSSLAVVPAVIAGLAVVCCLLTFAADSPLIGFRLPLIPRQVDERWLGRYRRWIYASGFGLQIGVGLATYVMTAAVYLIPALGALSGSPVLAMLLGLLFGLVRGLPILLSSRSHGPEQLLRLHRRLAALEPWSLVGVMLAQAGAAVAFGAAAGGVAGWSAAGVILLVITSLSRWRSKTVARERMQTDRLIADGAVRAG